VLLDRLNSLSADVRFGAHDGLKSDIVSGPKSAINGPVATETRLPFFSEQQT
jgi:hypothetical protein